MNEKRLRNVETLHGFLTGVIAMRGELHQYSAFAYLLENVPGDTRPEEAIREFYGPQFNFTFDGARELQDGEVDSLVGAWLVGESVRSEAVADRGGVVSFRVFDLVDLIFAGDQGRKSVYRLDSRGSGAKSECTFLCIRSGSEMLAMQFNDNSVFRPALGPVGSTRDFDR
jgi:hypothetical protein